MWNRILIFNRYESAMKSYFIHTFQVRILSQTQISKEVHMNLNSVELYNIIQCLILFQKIQLHLKYAFKSRKPFRFLNSLSISLSCWCRFLSENCIWYGIYDTPDFPIFMNVQWLWNPNGKESLAWYRTFPTGEDRQYKWGGNFSVHYIRAKIKMVDKKRISYRWKVI